MYQDDISFLVSETMNFSKFREEELIPESSGVLFNLQKLNQVFVIRMHESDNLREDFKLIQEDPNGYPDLRLEDIDKLKFFECDHIEIAKKLKEELSNKRFPLFEENVINISDPSYSWWLKDEGNSFKIYFRLSHTEDISKLNKIGSLYNSKNAVEKMRNLHHYLPLFFPLSHFVCTPFEIAIGSKDINNPYYSSFKNIFTEGEIEQNFLEYLRKLEVYATTSKQALLKPIQDLHYYLIELATNRRFWKVIEKELQEN